MLFGVNELVVLLVRVLLQWLPPGGSDYRDDSLFSSGGSCSSLPHLQPPFPDLVPFIVSPSSLALPPLERAPQERKRALMCFLAFFISLCLSALVAAD